MVARKSGSLEAEMRDTLENLDLTLTDSQLLSQLRSNISINMLVSSISRFYPEDYTTEKRVNFVIFLVNNADQKGVVECKMGKICLFTLYIKLRKQLNGKIARISNDKFIALMRVSVVDEAIPDQRKSVKKRVEAAQ